MIIEERFAVADPLVTSAQVWPIRTRRLFARASVSMADSVLLETEASTDSTPITIYTEYHTCRVLLCVASLALWYSTSGIAHLRWEPNVS